MNKKPIHSNRWFILVLLIISTLISSLDSTVINVIIPSIANHFGIEINKSEWLISSYILSMSIMFLCCGWMANKYGFKTMYFIGIGIFTLGSFLCSIAPSINFLICMRALQGVGSGIIIPLSMTIIAHDFTGKDRDLAIGFWIMTISISSTIGPIVGGYLVKIDEWNWVFKINIPIGIILMVVVLFVMNNYKVLSVRKFDYIGVLLLLIWAPLSLYILSSNVEWQLILLLIISFTLFVLRMIYARTPLININVFKNNNFILAFIVMLCFGIILFGGNYMVTQYLLYGLHYSAYKVGLILMPAGIIQGFLSPFIGSYIYKYGSFKFILAGLIVILIYLYLSSEISSASPHWYISLTLYLRGLGIGLSLTAITNLSLKNVKKTEIDTVSGVINTVKQLSGSLSIGVISMIIINKTDKEGVLSVDGYTSANKESLTYLAILVVICIVAMLFIKKKGNSVIS